MNPDFAIALPINNTYFQRKISEFTENAAARHAVRHAVQLLLDKRDKRL